MSLRSFLIFSGVLILAVLLACTDAPMPPLVATEVEITHPLPGMTMSAGYLTLTNNSDVAIRITSVSSPQVGSVEIHETVIEDEISRMRPVRVLVVGAGETLRMQRGGLHLMMRSLDEQTSAITLNLYADDRLLLSLGTHLVPAGD